MAGILYLDKAPKLLVDAPTATANTMENTKHINSLGSAKATRKKLPIPRLKKKKPVKKSKIED